MQIDGAPAWLPLTAYFCKTLSGIVASPFILGLNTEHAHQSKTYSVFSYRIEFVMNRELVRTLMGQHSSNRPEEQHDVSQHGPVLHVVDVQILGPLLAQVGNGI